MNYRPRQAIHRPSNKRPSTSIVKEDAAKPMTKIFSQLGEAAKKVLQLNKEPLAPGPQHIQKNEDAGKSTLLKQDSQLTLKELANQLLERVISSPLEKSVITPKLLTSTPQQVGLIQQMLRVAQAKAETLNVGMQNIEQALTDPELVKQGTDPNHKQLVEQLLQQTKTTLPQGKESDAQQIKQLLTSPAINLTPSQLVSATTNQGFISGLVAMLQMSLSARLTRAQTSRDDHVARALNAILPQSAKAKSALTGKGLNEFLQLEQKHQLAREIGRLFAGHQTNKLHNAEQLLQGQESVYYNIPALMNGTFQDVELLIKREEQQKEQNDQAASSHKTWQLTMKLTIGELGELLTKAKLRPDNLEVDFYASNQEVKIQVMNYLPLLKRKLESLGIEVSKSQCQLGKIPDSLQQRPYHVFQTKV
ncbi:flagellar hook-length control protein FliK [Paraglaciecola aquimarina]|uniref:Flagellar hook-length control protein FliK n=1 Tax=Paraglaciecola aquimarina TaxID=1235557 RepID=A0ABU3T1Q5_9ALTE|nr:flagellar hook-length control protein FliK [Paraglaciecola aquimarina]MDU0356138.1 flagellar hook-length control protein FliK [Paraglaciecola aquimarina]